jgi:predicted O-linked N-acetylglucosamine transferase (SPINDLY family)
VAKADAAFAEALAHHQAGRNAVAIAGYERALVADPRHVGALNNLAALYAQAGRAADARKLYDRALKAAPGAAAVLKSYGLFLLGTGQTAEAKRLLSAAAAVAADDPETAFHLGNLLQAEGRDAEAAAEYTRAAAKAPTVPEVHNNLAAVLVALGRHDEAVASAERALKFRADFAQAHNTLGNALAGRGDFTAAAAAYGRALDCDPRFRAARVNRAQMLVELGEAVDARAELDTLLADQPHDATVLNALGLAEQRLGRHTAAVAIFDRALAVNPRYLQALNNKATSEMALGRHEDALALYRQALDLAPDSADTSVNVGHALQSLGRHAEAASAFRRALALDPRREAVLPYLIHALLHVCQWDDVEALIERMLKSLADRLAAGRPISASPFGLAGTPASAALRLASARALSAEVARSVAGLVRAAPHASAKPPGGKLRIGYVSPDFREHSLALVFGGLLAAHDRAAFAWYGYSVSPRPALSFASYEATFDGFADLGQVPLEDAAARIRADGIDILIDLAGHTRDARLELFVLKPAPVQAHYLGYGSTLGADFIPYLLTDPVHTPPALEAACSEALVFLPETFMAAPPVPIADRRFSRAECGLPDDAFVFADFNAHYKLDPRMFGCWMRLLAEVPASVLWLRDGTAIANGNLRAAAARHGIAPARLVFAPRLPRADHLARHRLADLGLDTLHHTGGVTTVDALWAGVPVITIAGATHSSRTGASLLAAVGLPELIVGDLDAYTALALRFARDREWRAAIADKLARQRSTAPLFDIGRLARDLETAYRMMWERYRRGEPPGTIRVPRSPR